MPVITKPRLKKKQRNPSLAMNLLKGKAYGADIKLKGLDSIAPNDTVKVELVKLGFDRVTVTGKGTDRKAEGVWTKDTVNAETMLNGFTRAKISNIKAL